MKNTNFNFNPEDIRVCLFSTVQGPNNVRLFHREARSLAKFGFDVHVIVQSDCSGVRDGVHFYPFKVSCSRIFRMFLTPWIMMFKVLKIKATIYHFHDPELLPVGFIMRWLFFKKVVFDMRESTARQIMGKEYLPIWSRFVVSFFYGIMEKICLKGVSLIVANDRSVEEYKKAYLVRNFPEIDEQLINTSMDMEERLKIPLLVYVGGVWKSRGALIYIELAKRLVERGFKIKIMIIGAYEKSFGKALEDKIHESKLNDIVQITGPMNYPDAMKLTSQALIGLSILEPIPNYTFCLAGKITEYMMCGTPVLASKFNHWSPYVEGVQSGMMVDPNNMEGIVDVCEKMLNNPDELKKMGKRGVEAILNKYNWDTEFKQLLKCYNDLLK